MSPEKTGPDGRYRLDLVVNGIRFRNTTSRKLAIHNRCKGVIHKLVEAGRIDEVMLLKKKPAQGGITPLQLLDADRKNRKSIDSKRIQLSRRVLATAERIFSATDKTQRRYQISFTQLQQAGVITDRTRLQGLAKIDWVALEATWGNSAADWNHLRRAVSRLLTLELGLQHPFRSELLARFPSREELERYVELSPEEFAAIIAPADPAVQDALWTLAGTGIRSESEYELLTRAMLGHYQVNIRFSKTAGGHRNIPVDPALWQHVLNAVPCPVSVDTLSRIWSKLAAAAGRPELLLRDLRHCYGFWSLDAGIEIHVLRDAMGHKSLTTTQRYVRQRATRVHATKLAQYMKGTTQVPQVVPHPARRQA
jgi:integrase